MERFVVRRDIHTVIITNQDKLLVGRCDFAEVQPQKIGQKEVKQSSGKPDADAIANCTPSASMGLHYQLFGRFNNSSTNADCLNGLSYVRQHN